MPDTASDAAPEPRSRGASRLLNPVVNAPAAFHLLAKPSGAICNLDCSYCFFLAKDQLYPGSDFRMSSSTLENYLRQLLEAHRTPEVTVAWQGGEPTLMGLDFFERAVELVGQLARPGQRIEHTIQTNATLIDDAWAEFLLAHDFLVGVSVDGPREMHDAYRVDKGGKPTFDRVIAGLDRLKAHGVRWNALTTVNRANEDHGRVVYHFLRDELAAQHIQFIPIVERNSPGGIPIGNQVTDRSVSPEGYGRFLMDVFDEWMISDVGTVFVQMFDTTLANTMHVPGAVCVHAETCGRSLALEHNGDVYSCDHFVDPEYLLGNIAEQHLLTMVASPQQVEFGLAKRDELPRQCLSCEVRTLCNGGCPKDRFEISAAGDPGLNYLCPSYLAFFNHVSKPMQRMAQLIHAGGFADQIMAE